MHAHYTSPSHDFLVMADDVPVRVRPMDEALEDRRYVACTWATSYRDRSKVPKVVYRRELQAAADPIARRNELVDEYTERYANPYIAAERGYIDDVIDPADTRIKLVAGLELLESKREELPKRKHGNVPL